MIFGNSNPSGYPFLLLSFSVISLDKAAGFSIHSLFWVIIGCAILFWFYPTSWRKIRERITTEKNSYKVNLFVAINNQNFQRH